jgi:hypothetical protein
MVSQKQLTLSLIVRVDSGCADAVHKNCKSQLIKILIVVSRQSLYFNHGIAHNDLQVRRVNGELRIAAEQQRVLGTWKY